MSAEAFFKLTYGLYILSSKDGDQFNGHISNTVFQITADPPRITVATHKDNLTTDFIRKSKLFSVSVLQLDVNLDFMGPFGFKSGREINKFENVEYKIGQSGVPIVTQNCVAFFECEVEEEIVMGTHVMFIGRVIDRGVIDDHAKPLSYAYYREVIKGVSPKHSPTHLKDEDQDVPSEQADEVKVTDERLLKKYRCTICGYIYDPIEGDPPAGISAGTAFEDIPDEWTCPICGVTKDDFIPYD